MSASVQPSEKTEGWQPSLDGHNDVVFRSVSTVVGEQSNAMPHLGPRLLCSEANFDNTVRATKDELSSSDNVQSENACEISNSAAFARGVHAASVLNIEEDSHDETGCEKRDEL